MAERNTINTVSIIIPAKNEERLLPLCLQSISRLDYPRDHLEVIVVDNGSTDRTREIAAGFGAIVLGDATKHVAGLRNLGAHRARGEVLAFVDADCTVAPAWLNEASRYFSEPGVVAWGGPPAIPDNATWVQRAWYLVRKKEGVVQAVDWLESMNLFVRKTDFVAINGFDERLVTCEDVDFSYRLAQRGNIVADSRIHMVHLGEAATLRQFWRKEFWRGLGNYAGVKAHGLSRRELPTLLLPLYYALAVPLALVWAMATISPKWISVATMAVLSPSLLGLFKLRHKTLTPTLVFHLLVLLQVYFLARTVAAIRHFCSTQYPWGGHEEA